jgi:NADH dehydrogenase
MTPRSIHAVTGAFGYSGKYIARRLVAAGHRVITLTNSAGRENPFGNAVKAFALDFTNPKALAKTLEGVSVLYNTYWVRFNHRNFTHADAVQNTRILFRAARDAGVERVVHISITNPSEISPLGYFRGKALLERALIESGLSFAILRPTVLFGKEDILINNIAWLLRRLPVFGMFGDGEYKLQPIYVDDLAELAVRAGLDRSPAVINAVGPETFTYRGLIEEIGTALGKRRPIIRVSPRVGHLAGRMLGMLVKDVVITREEIEGLMAGLLCVDTSPTGSTRLTDWARENSATLGRSYASELARRRDRITSYERL